MKKVRAICLKAHAPSVIGALHRMGVLHIKDCEIRSLERSGPLPSFDEVSERSVRIKSMMEAMGAKKALPKKPISIEDPLREADRLLEDFDTLLALQKSRDELSAQLEANLSHQSALSELENLHVDFSHLQSASLKFVLLKAATERIEAAAKALAGKSNISFAVAQSSKGMSVMLVAIPAFEDQKKLEKFGAIHPLPSLSSTPRHELSVLREAEKSLRERHGAAIAKLERFAQSRHPKLSALYEALEIEAERCRIATQFSATDSLYFMEGYVEASKFPGIAQELRRLFGSKVAFAEAPMHHELAPTKLENPKQVGPFQFLVEFLSTTRYDEIDPSTLLLVTIPLIYALIFGDAGYAIFSFLIASYLIKISKEGALLNQISKIWRISAIPAFFAGIIFDEYFGFTHEHLLSLFGYPHTVLYHGMHRVSEINTLMLITIIVGMLHLGAGFLLGAINEWHHSRKHAYAKLCWLGVEISGFFLVAALMFGAFPEFALPAGALMAVCIAGLIYAEGLIAAVEIPSLASNIMSYIRIAAVGVGGVILAEAINELLLPRLELSPAGIIIFILTAIVYLSAHLAACVLAMFESFIHGARLNVVEFFGKFYKGNGMRFAPFAARRVYSNEVLR